MVKQLLNDGREDGCGVGHDATDKVGFFGATPVVQQDGGDAVATTAATNSSPYGYSEAQANAIVVTLNKIHAALKAYGLID